MDTRTQRARAFFVVMGLTALFVVSRPVDAEIVWKAGCEWCADSCWEVSSGFCENSSGDCAGPVFCNDMQVCINYEEHVQAVTIRCRNME
jgi:peptide methionine sulfoxide reductase MsrA